MNEQQKKELERAKKHIKSYLLWVFPALLVLSGLCAAVDMPDLQCQILGFTTSLVVLILTAPPKVEPEKPKE